jgi:YVTN family beta-propeller protein
MKKFIACCTCIILFMHVKSQSVSQIESARVNLPNGWSITPVGKSLPLGDLPLNIAVAPTKPYIAVTNNGQSVQSVQLIDIKKNKVLASVEIAKSWYGLKFSGDSKLLYASGGNDNMILIYKTDDKQLVLTDSIILGKKWPEKISPAGIEIDDAAKLLYVVTKENSALYVIDLTTKKIKSTLKLGGEGYACLLSPDKSRLYISCWGCDKLLVYDVKAEKITDRVNVGDNPNEFCMRKDGSFLFVANANDNSVSVIDAKKLQVVETLNAALFANAPSGSTSNGVALSPDEKTLYVANADNNCLAVFNVSQPGNSKSIGFIPTGWYPTQVKAIGKNIYVTNGKGFTSMPNVKGPDPTNKTQTVIYQGADYKTQQQKIQYIAGLFKGTLSIIPVPGEKQLGEYSTVVYHNTPYTHDKEMMAEGEPGNPIPSKVGDKSPIKYVFYVIKENRTYDQVLGDIPGGNGDTSLVLFGERVTPNLHKAAREFVLLDNFYANGEVSADGHNWTMGGYATDYLEKTWPTNYGKRGGSYDAEGHRDIANNKGGFFWDLCKRSNVSYRTYGEFTDDFKPSIPVLYNNFSPTYSGWNLDIRDTTRFYQWKREFDSLLANNAVPHFNSVRMGNDHTQGLRKNQPSPFAYVADNDLAVGMFIDYLSKSSIWNETAIFIVEDDAQNGPDHVDAHRTTAYVAGGFVKQGYIDHTPYSTTSMLRTMELILGMPPMTQYDAAATPMWRCFNQSANHPVFNAVPAQVNLNDINLAMNEWQQKSEQFNFAKEDAIPDMEFNFVLWHGIKGAHVPYPAPNRAAFLKQGDKKDDDD